MTDAQRMHVANLAIWHGKQSLIESKKTGELTKTRTGGNRGEKRLFSKAEGKGQDFS
jgi:hypothetical protein